MSGYQPLGELQVSGNDARSKYACLGWQLKALVAPSIDIPVA